MQSPAPGAFSAAVEVDKQRAELRSPCPPQAWATLQGMPRLEAMELYIQLAGELAEQKARRGVRMAAGEIRHYTECRTPL